MNAPTPPTGPAAAAPPSVLIRAADSPQPEPTSPDWLWHGFLAAKNITLLTGLWKLGKTTLVSLLLARMESGGVLAGRCVRPGRAVVVTDEHKLFWAMRGQLLNIAPHARVLSQPFPGRRPTPDDWQNLIAYLDAYRHEEGLNLLVIDALASFLTGSENDPATVLRWLHALRRLTAGGVSVLILHHPKKKAPAPGHAARGCGALTRAVDINVEMEALTRGIPIEDRKRVLCGYSPWPETPRRLVIELTADGTDYLVVGQRPATSMRTDGLDVLLRLLRDAVHPLTRSEILSAWPADHAKPNDVTLWRWLRRAVMDGQVLRAGTGRRCHPFVYTPLARSGAVNVPGR
jgi:AAA domain